MPHTLCWSFLLTFGANNSPFFCRILEHQCQSALHFYRSPKCPHPIQQASFFIFYIPTYEDRWYAVSRAYALFPGDLDLDCDPDCDPDVDCNLELTTGDFGLADCVTEDLCLGADLNDYFLNYMTPLRNVSFI